MTTVLDEVYFVVNLYSFPLPLVHQANSSFSKVSHLSPSQVEQIPKIPLPLLFLLTLLFWGYLNSMIRINKMVNSLDYHPCPSRLASRIHPFIFLYTHEGFISLSLQNACWIFSQTLIFHHMWEKFSNLWSWHSWKMHWFEVFLLIPFPTQNSPPSSCHRTLGRRKLLILLGSILSKICFSQQQKRVEETMICFIKIQSEIFYILYDLQFFQMWLICE